jgi:hypothetical protein
VKGELKDSPVARAEVLSSIGIALMYEGDDDTAYPLLREAPELRRKALGPDESHIESNEGKPAADVAAAKAQRLADAIALVAPERAV